MSISSNDDLRASWNAGFSTALKQIAKLLEIDADSLVDQMTSPLSSYSDKHKAVNIVLVKRLLMDSPYMAFMDVSDDVEVIKQLDYPEELRGIPRNDRIVRARLRYDMTYEQIGRIEGLTRDRIRQIFHKMTNNAHRGIRLESCNSKRFP